MASAPKASAKEPERVGMREFREKIAKYVLDSDAPVILTRHGAEVGYFIPLKPKRLSEEELKAFTEAGDRVQQMLAEKGLDGDQIVEEFERERKARRRAELAARDK